MTRERLPVQADDTVVLPRQRVAPEAGGAHPNGTTPAVAPAEPPGPARTALPGRLVMYVATLGHAPAVLALSSAGVAVVAAAYAGGRSGASWATAAYWLGQVLVFTPVVARLLAGVVTVVESYVLVVGLAVLQYLQKWMYSPDQFRFPDELQHWSATNAIVITGDLFRHNYGLPVAQHFPGLAEMGASVALLAGLPVTAAGMIVAAVAHLAFVCLIFGLVRRMGGSPRLAGLSCVLYATSLHYLFFDSMYVYQTGALPLFMLAVWAAMCWRHERRTWAYLVVTALAIAGVTVTHHVTAMLTVATLLLLGACDAVFTRPRRYGVLLLGGGAAGTVLAWFLLVASDVTAYLSPPARGLLAAAVQVLHGKLGGAAAGGAAPPAWETGVQALTLLVLFGVYLSRLRAAVRSRSRDAWQWSLLIGGLTFFGASGLHFFGSQGPELAGRAATFTYLPIALLTAATVTDWRRNRRLARRTGAAPAAAPRPRHSLRLASAAGLGLALLLLLAARVGGWPAFWGRLPGKHLVAGFERSVDPTGTTAARWTRGWMGPGNRFGADIDGGNLLSTYGAQQVVREAAPLYYSQQWGLADQQVMTRHSVDFVWVDLRLSRQTPVTGSYFSIDPLAGRHTQPISQEALTKFDAVVGANRLYDNGTIRIYDMRDS